MGLVSILQDFKLIANSIRTWSETEKFGLVSKNSMCGAKSLRTVRLIAVSWGLRLNIYLPLLVHIRPICARHCKSLWPLVLQFLLPHAVWCALLSVPIISPFLCRKWCSASLMNFVGGSLLVWFSMYMLEMYSFEFESSMEHVAISAWSENCLWKKNCSAILLEKVRVALGFVWSIEGW